MLLFVCVFLHQPELMAEDKTGHTKIDGSQNPEDADLGQDLANAGTHTIHTDKGAHAKVLGKIHETPCQ